jgi:hypothetical protein
VCGLGLTKWKSEWDQTIKVSITKLLFPKIADRLKLKMNVTPIITGNGDIESDLCGYRMVIPANAENKQQTTYCLTVNYLSWKERD